MKIIDLESFSLRVPMDIPKAIATRPILHRDFSIVRIYTDEGITGVGYTFDYLSAYVANGLKNVILGKDPYNVEEIWYSIYANRGISYQKGVGTRALSMIDMAIWDIIGKSLNVPLFRLLGYFRDKIPCYASAGYYTYPPEAQKRDELVEEMCNLKNRGMKYLKMRIGGLSIEEDIKRVQAVKDALGEDVQLMVDANNAYNLLQAMKIGKILEKMGIFWFEEPLTPDDRLGYQHLTKELNVPIVSGELEYTKFSFRDIIENKQADIIQPDACVCGGVTEWKKISALADVYSFPIAPHVIGDGGVNLHLASSSPNVVLIEYFFKESKISKVEEIFEEYQEPRDGYVYPPSKPGLGLTLRRKAIEEYRLDKVRS